MLEGTNVDRGVVEWEGIESSVGNDPRFRGVLPVKLGDGLVGEYIGVLHPLVV
jgi:hypothetical protein